MIGDRKLETPWRGFGGTLLAQVGRSGFLAGHRGDFGDSDGVRVL